MGDILPLDVFIKSDLLTPSSSSSSSPSPPSSSSVVQRSRPTLLLALPLLHYEAPPPSPPSSTPSLSTSSSATHSRGHPFAFLQRGLNLLNTKGFLLILVLFLFRFRTFSDLAKRLTMFSLAMIALCANFNLDQDSKARKRGLTPGISRLVLLGTLYVIWKKSNRAMAPFYSGLALRVVPIAMFFFFKGLYFSLWKLLKFCERTNFLSSPPSTSSSSSSTEKEKEKEEQEQETTLLQQHQCCICLDMGCDFTTECRHSFHRCCFERWMEVKSHCPLCNQPVHARNLALLSHQLRPYFLLQYADWKDMHSFLCGDW
ncbi:RING-type E3 ubiquitin transferase, variant 2 [Balamuthia mandrillaris]